MTIRYQGELYQVEHQEQSSGGQASAVAVTSGLDIRLLAVRLVADGHQGVGPASRGADLVQEKVKRMTLWVLLNRNNSHISGMAKQKYLAYDRLLQLGTCLYRLMVTAGMGLSLIGTFEIVRW